VPGRGRAGACEHTPDPALVPGTADGCKGVTPCAAKPSSTTDWYRLFFPKTTNFGLTSGANVPWLTYDWNYSASVVYTNGGGTTVSCTQNWNDQINPGDDGQGPADGDVTGTCPS